MVQQRDDAGWEQGGSERGDRFWVYFNRVVVTRGERGGGRAKWGRGSTVWRSTVWWWIESRWQWMESRLLVVSMM